MVAAALLFFLYFRRDLKGVSFRHRGIQAAVEKRWDEAFAYLSRAEKLGRDDVELYLTLARACLNTGRRCGKSYAKKAYIKKKREESILLYASLFPAEAREVLEEGVQLFPFSSAVHLALGWWWLERDTDRAHRLFLKAKSLDRDAPEVYYALGVLMEKEGESEESLQFYQEALFLNPLYIRAAEGKKRVEKRVR